MLPPIRSGTPLQLVARRTFRPQNVEAISVKMPKQNHIAKKLLALFVV
jgi:hypothetical protein